MMLSQHSQPYRKPVFLEFPNVKAPENFTREKYVEDCARQFVFEASGVESLADFAKQKALDVGDRSLNRAIRTRVRELEAQLNAR
jgi:hypothetical protein